MRAGFLALLLVAAVASASAAGPSAPSHAAMFEHYEGTKTCLACHQQEAESFFHSQHYQWEGQAPDIVNAHGRRLGKMNTVNDFCTNPKANWIGLVYNSRGEVISKGCSACHAGFGKLPSPKMDQAQLENIDCLMCHASGYQRDLYKNDDGSLQWKPILWKNPVGLDSVSKRISLPKRVMCLRCHASSGGGPNYKRGDLEYKLADADRNFDVHMGTDGKNMQCVACHAGDDHRVRGLRQRSLRHRHALPSAHLRYQRVPRLCAPQGGSAQPARAARQLHRVPHPRLRQGRPHRHVARLVQDGLQCRGRQVHRRHQAGEGRPGRSTPGTTAPPGSN